MHGEKPIGANRFYQEYIQDKDHVHLNWTRWKTLSGFVRYLGSSGLCTVQVSDPSLPDSDLEKFTIAYIKKGEHREKKRPEKEASPLGDRVLEEQIERGLEAAAKQSNATDKLEGSDPGVKSANSANATNSASSASSANSANSAKSILIRSSPTQPSTNAARPKVGFKLAAKRAPTRLKKSNVFKRAS